MTTASAIFLMLQLAKPAPGLRWQGAAVHPGCIQELTTELADSSPIVAAIDLEGCRDSNKYSTPYETDGAILRWRDPADQNGGYFQYEFLGALSNGVQIV